MANRFDKHNRKFALSDRSYRVLSVVIFLMIAVLFVLAVEYSGRSTIEKQQESLG